MEANRFFCGRAQADLEDLCQLINVVKDEILDGQSTLRGGLFLQERCLVEIFVAVKELERLRECWVLSSQ